jgi:hypothetical protein
VYDEDDCTIQGEVQFTGSNRNGIYKLHMVQNMAHAAASETKMQRLWYRRLGHLCGKSMATGIEFSDTDDEPCAACIKGKHSKAVFKCSKYRAVQKLDLIHSDVCGPMEEENWGGVRLDLRKTIRQNRYNATAFSRAINKKHDDNRKTETDWGSLFTIPTVNIIQDQQITVKI